jgi:hypothetical protein
MRPAVDSAQQRLENVRMNHDEPPPIQATWHPLPVRNEPQDMAVAALQQALGCQTSVAEFIVSNIVLATLAALREPGPALIPPPEPASVAMDDAVVSAYSILALLHHRGLVDSENNRRDVKMALDKLYPFCRASEHRLMQGYGR